MTPRRRGFAIVEFALGIGVLLAVLSGTFQLGYALIQYSRLETAVSQAAQYASMIPYDSATSTPTSAYLASVRNMALYGSPQAGAAPVTPGLAATHIAVTPSFTNGVPTSLRVSVTGYTIDAVFASYTLNGKPAASYPYRGVWAPQ